MPSFPICLLVGVSSDANVPSVEVSEKRKTEKSPREAKYRIKEIIVDFNKAKR